MMPHPLTGKAATMNSRLSALLPLFSLLAATGCSDSDQGDLDVGDETRVLGAALYDYAANWDGYAEAYQVPGDRTDRVRLVLDEAGVGTLRFGEAELFPAPSQPEEKYPPVVGDEQNAEAALEQVWEYYLRSGFEYPVTGAQVTDQRLQLTVELSSMMDPWCALVTIDVAPDFICGDDGFSSGFDENGGYHCNTGTMLQTPIDCNVAAQCSQCDCDGATCVGRDRGVLLFDAALTENGNGLEGTLLTDQGERVTIRMTR
jgi:hypothetical protein